MTLLRLGANDALLEGYLQAAQFKLNEGGTKVRAQDCNQHFNKDYAQNGAIANATIAIHVVRGSSGTIKSFEAGSITAETGANSATVDLKKNGTTCLSSVITLDSSNTAYVPEAGTLSVTSVSDGDVLTVVVTDSSSDLTGLFASLSIDEDYPS